MKNILYSIAAFCLVVSPAYAHENHSEKPVQTKEKDPFEDEMRNIRVKSVRTYTDNSIQYDRTHTPSRYKYFNPNPFCVTRKVTDEYGYVHYLTRCR
jgi:hypothetical protein